MNTPSNRPFSIVIALILAIVCGVVFAQKRDEEADAWARRAAALQEERTSFEVVKARSDKSVSPEDDWKSSLETLGLAPKDIGAAMAVFQFLRLYSPIYKNDKYVADRSRQLAKRAQSLSPSVVDKWAESLSKVERLSRLWAVGLLVSIDSAFSAEAYDTARGSALLVRLDRLPEASKSALAEVLKIGASDAAVLLVQEPKLWSAQGSFSTVVFERYLAALRAQLKPK